MFDSATERSFFEETLPQIARGRTVLLVLHGEAMEWARSRLNARVAPLTLSADFGRSLTTSL